MALLAQPAAKPGAATPMKAVGSVELTDPAGDIEPIVYRESVGDGPEKEVKYPGFDVVKLAVTSDGTTLSFAATLTAPPASAAFDVLEFFVDADNSSATGITPPASPAALAGLEFYGTLEVCLEHTCSAHDARAPPMRPGGPHRHRQPGEIRQGVDVQGHAPGPAGLGLGEGSQESHDHGPVVQASVPYAAMGLKPGQTIRLVVREACAGKMAGFFPDIVLTLK